MTFITIFENEKATKWVHTVFEQINRDQITSIHEEEKPSFPTRKKSKFVSYFDDLSQED